ncbi:DnaJ C-terminal domain-containing protein [Methylococcus sp. Mc7]|uniref:DnaJ C-terminal domain-containing protein n=1 Tax=Methylococcus sp. Mc7 TaxID=2860258 RepID=UPI001C52936B|nr:DnaJ C-terminal domain-containing protein [Methylococcus sp. Mc7]QXP84391.1 DnaJ domain-containing protein [Methylococcus sp. Mc7]
MQFKDYYQIMGISRDASQEEIKRTYRKLARKFHPDVSKEPDAEERFKEINEAYEVLQDKERRAAYDRLASGRSAGEPFQPPPDWHFEFHGDIPEAAAHGVFSDFFETLFGDAMRERAGRHRSVWDRPMAGQDRHLRLQIDLELAYRGGMQAVTLSTPEIDGQGRIAHKDRTLNIKIPRGVREGQHIRLPGLGLPGLHGGPAGDLYLEIRFKPHPWFRAEGHDIYLDLPVTPWEAALGAVVTIKTPDDARLELRIPPGSQTGQKLRLKGKGLGGDPPGDLYARLRVVAPPAKSERARALYEQLAQAIPFNPRASMGI